MKYDLQQLEYYLWITFWEWLCGVSRPFKENIWKAAVIAHLVNFVIFIVDCFIWTYITVSDMHINHLVDVITEKEF